MTSIFEFTLPLLWMIVILETVIFRHALSETARTMRLLRGYRDPERRQLSQGEAAPEFTARVSGTELTVNTTELKGCPTIMLFISPDDLASPGYDKLAVSTHALWHKGSGHLYLVCAGAEQPCRKLLRDHTSGAFELAKLPLIIDENRRITQSFLIGTTPLAVMLDKDARVSHYGHPLSSEEEATNASN